MSFNQAARTAGSALCPNIAPGSDSTPSLITITSISPTRSANLAACVNARMVNRA
jgi:hypothetical protein